MSTNQIASKRKKKFTGGNASKRHRDRVNIEFNNLAKLLPFPENVIAKLDKSSILRLAVSYIRAKSFFKDTLSLEENKQERGSTSKRNNDSIYKGILEETCLTELFLQALDGFLIVITEDLKVLYVSDSVRDYLGYCQAGIIHESFLQFIHLADKKNITNALMINDTKTEKTKRSNGEHSSLKLNGQSALKNGDHNGFYADSSSNDKIESRRFVCRMKCAFSCSSRFYTAFRAFQFTGHVRRSTIQEGKESRTLNTLIAFGTPSSSSKFDPLNLVSDIFDEPRIPCSEDIDQEGANMKMIGLHIEPRLRPHIAPIPIPQNETEGRQSVQLQCPNYTRRYNVNMHPDPSCNGHFNHPTRLGSAFKMLSDCYQDGGRYSGRWDPRSSSLSNSPISDASSPSGMKRASSADTSPDHWEVQNNVKNARFDESYHRNNDNRYSSMQLDDIHSSARILMQLQGTQKRIDGKRHELRDYESDCSSDDKSEISVGSVDIVNRTSGNSISPKRRHEDMPDCDRPVNGSINNKVECQVNGYSPKERRDFSNSFNSEAAYANGFRIKTGAPDGLVARACEQNGRVRYNTEREIVVPKRMSPPRLSPANPPQNPSSSPAAPCNVSPTRFSPLRTLPSNQSPQKKDPNRGFHISTILGLDEKIKPRSVVAGQRESHETTDRPKNGIIQNGVHEDMKKMKLTEKSMIGIHHKDISMSHITNDPSNLDDIKTSFAHILQGLTATITQSIDKTIDTIFKPSETKSYVSKSCK